MTKIAWQNFRPFLWFPCRNRDGRSRRNLGVSVRKGIVDPSLGSSAEQGIWPSDARAVWSLLGTVLLSALFFSWLWQAFRLYSSPDLVPYNDEAGQLFHMPLFAGLGLVAYGLWLRFFVEKGETCRGYAATVLGSTRLKRRIVTLILVWTPVLLMVVPVSEEYGKWVLVWRWSISALAGVGTGIAGYRIGLALSRFSGGRLVLALGLTSIMTPVFNYLALLCPGRLWVFLAVLLPLLFVLLPQSQAAEEDDETRRYPFARIPLFFWSGWLFTAFSESAYYNLYGALEPVFPGPSLSVLLLVALGGLSALLVLGQAHRSPIWYAFLLVIPVLVVGYTAWPLLHRESPGLSLGGLLFGYTLLNVYMMTAFFHTASCYRGVERVQLLVFGFGGLALASWLGSHNSGWIAESIARGDSLNSLFAFQAFAILAGSFIFVVYLEMVGFFRMAKGESVAERGAASQSGTPLSLMDWPLEDLESHFRELGLTRQQAMIAALLARKTPDATICDNLNISPSTLKTHIRNIHRRLGISSRHELAWLVTATPAGVAEVQNSTVNR